MSDELRDLLVSELDVREDDLYEITGPLGLSTFMEIQDIDFFGEIRRGDILRHHPYDSFRSTLGAFLRQASTDRRVVAIKMALYRTSGDSSIIRT